MRESGQSSCDEVRAWLDDYLDQELPPARTRDILRHLEICAACARRFRRAYQELAALRDAVRKVAVPADLMARIARKLSR